MLDRFSWMRFSASLVGTSAALILIAAPFLNLDPSLTSYFGNIAGGVTGGAMTVFAGWLAWTAAKEQIGSQQQQLELMRKQLELSNDEHRKRLHRFYGDARAEVVNLGLALFVENQAAMKAANLLETGAEIDLYKYSTDIPLIKIFEHDDSWRSSHEIITDFWTMDSLARLLNGTRSGVNNENPIGANNIRQQFIAIAITESRKLLAKLDRELIELKK